MEVNFNVNESGGCNAPVVSTNGSYNVRAKYVGQQDAGHLYGVFSTRQQAEACVLALAGRDDVQSATIESA